MLESSPSLRASGFAFTTWTNAFRALDALGVGDKIRRQHLQAQAYVVVTTSHHHHHQGVSPCLLNLSPYICLFLFPGYASWLLPPEKSYRKWTSRSRGNGEPVPRICFTHSSGARTPLNVCVSV